MASVPPVCDFGWKAADFRLPSTDGRQVELADVRGPSGTLVVFICNHCPYVTGAIARIVRDAGELAPLGVGTVAISANDAAQYPEDGFAAMKDFAERHRLPFPYLYDESQAVARAYGAVCTPDFFGFNSKLELQYRGRLDTGRKDEIPGARRDLFEAMSRIAETGQGPSDQVASMGCSIKWKAA